MLKKGESTTINKLIVLLIALIVVVASIFAVLKFDVMRGWVKNYLPEYKYNVDEEIDERAFIDSVKADYGSAVAQVALDKGRGNLVYKEGNQDVLTKIIYDDTKKEFYVGDIKKIPDILDETSSYWAKIGELSHDKVMWDLTPNKCRPLNLIYKYYSLPRISILENIGGSEIVRLNNIRYFVKKKEEIDKAKILRETCDKEIISSFGKTLSFSNEIKIPFNTKLWGCDILYVVFKWSFDDKKSRANIYYGSSSNTKIFSEVTINDFPNSETWKRDKCASEINSIKLVLSSQNPEKFSQAISSILTTNQDIIKKSDSLTRNLNDLINLPANGERIVKINNLLYGLDYAPKIEETK